MASIRYKSVEAGGCRVSYREAGDSAKPAILLLHGFPSASHMFRELMADLADGFHLVAPDMPGFGQTVYPDSFPHTFDALARTVEAFTDALGLERYALYLFDYGAPVGFRLAMRHPERVTAIVSQNGNAYEEGLGPKWAARKEYWANPTPEGRAKFASAYAPETIVGQYTFGTPEGSVGPDGYTLDIHYVNLPGRAAFQDDLILDYRSNVALYPAFQQYLRESKPPLLAVWGKNDPSFIPPGAEAFRRDQPDAEVRFVDSGHFALESHHAEIAALMREFLGRVLPGAFRPMRRFKQQLPDEEALAVLRAAKRGVLSVTGDGGRPYGIPLNPFWDDETGRLYFHGAKEGHKIDALRRDPRACFTVLDEGVHGASRPPDWALTFRSVVVFGRVEFVEGQAEAIEICRRLARRFYPDEAAIEEEIRRAGAHVLVFDLVPEHITGKRVHEA